MSTQVYPQRDRPGSLSYQDQFLLTGLRGGCIEYASAGRRVRPVFPAGPSGRTGRGAQMERKFEYRGRTFLRVGEQWLDRDRLIVSDQLASKLCTEFGIQNVPEESKAKTKAKAKAKEKAEKAEAKAAKASKAAASKAAAAATKAPAKPRRKKADQVEAAESA